MKGFLLTSKRFEIINKFYSSKTLLKMAGGKNASSLRSASGHVGIAVVEIAEQASGVARNFDWGGGGQTSSFKPQRKRYKKLSLTTTPQSEADPENFGGGMKF